jgi:predicted LPLAT superfamily acyltransferase
MQTRRQPWLAQRERSNEAALRLLVWIARRLGRRAGRAVLVPVCVYFLLFSVRARRASRHYLGRVLGRAPNAADLFRHYYAFATVALDRVFFLADRWDLYDIEIHGEHIVRERLDRGQGCFLVGAHLGSFEALRAPARQRGLRVNLVMFEDNARNTASVLRAVNPELENDVIALGSPDSILRLFERLAGGGWVGMLGDRVLHESTHVRAPFLGGTAAFPAAPFRIAAIAGQPIVLMIGLYRGGNRYELHFERFADPPAFSRADRDRTIRDLVHRYASRLEHYCRIAPNNWFNFYDFWIDERATE